MDLLARHRARLVELGLEDVEDLADPGDPTSGAPGA
jgi:hypothetical protein